jgi:cytochrome c biogenesis protein CcmG/thiol:disulfide interchange protein DsbE
MRLLRYLLPLLVFAGIAVLLYGGLGKDTRIVPSPLIDKPAPAFDLPDLRDPTARVSKAGWLGKVYLLNVWGSWCPTCHEEHPVLAAFARQNVVPIVGLNWKDERETALRWLQQFGDPYTAIAQDVEGRTAIDFGIYGAPESFLIDAGGTIRWKHVGNLTPEIIERELKPRVAALAAGARS